MTKDHLLLELHCEDGFALHLFDHEHRVLAVILDGTITVSRYDGWVSVVHEAHGRHAETYLPADHFSHLTLLHPRDPQEDE